MWTRLYPTTTTPTQPLGYSERDLMVYCHAINLKEFLSFVRLSEGKVNISIDSRGVLIKGRGGLIQLGVGVPCHKKDGVDLTILLNNDIRFGRQMMIGLFQSGKIGLTTTLNDDVIFLLIHS